MLTERSVSARPETPSLRDRRALAAVAVFGAIVCTYAMRRVDPDLYGYLTYGRLFLEQGHLTTHDPFAYTSAGREWVTFEYVAHILLWIAYRAAGPAGLILLKCLVGGVAMYFLYAATRVATDDPFVSTPVFLLSASTVARFFLFRPQIFTFACFALFVSVLFRFLVRRRAPLWILPVIMLAWANTHGGFLAGLGALGLAICLRASENVSGWRSPRALLAGTKPLWIALAACFVVTFINPRGVRLWSYVLTEISHDTNRRYIAEWRPVSLHGDVWSAVALTTIAATLIVLGWIAQTKTPPSVRPRPIYWVISCLPIVWMAYRSVRHVPIAAIWAGPVIALLGSMLKDQRETVPWWRRLWFVIGGAASAAVIITLSAVFTRPWPEVEAAGPVLGRKHPCGAVSFMAANHLKGNVYNPLEWGSYITWQLYPDVRVSMDGRNISLFSDDLVVEHITFYSAEASAVDLAAPLGHDTDWLLVQSDFPRLSALSKDKRWLKVYADNDAILFVRADRAGSRWHSSATNGVAPSMAERCPKTLQ